MTSSRYHWITRAEKLYAFTVPQPVRPTFAPGSGWYQTGPWSPSSLADRRAMREAAFPCTVAVLYRSGLRLPARELLKREPPSGWLVCRDLYTAPAWYACLFSDDGMQREVMRLMRVQLERENGGVRLYGGLEVDDHGRRDLRQAWLCTPTPERAREILLEMLSREG